MPVVFTEVWSFETRAVLRAVEGIQGEEPHAASHVPFSVAVSPNWRYDQAMSTKYRFRDKYRIGLRERDHLPPHVHLTGGGVDVVISLESVTVTQGRAPAKVVQDALAWVAANQADLLKEWMKWHR